MFITNRYTMIYIPIFVNIVLLLLFGYRYLFFSLFSFHVFARRSVQETGRRIRESGKAFVVSALRMSSRKIRRPLILISCVALPRAVLRRSPLRSGQAVELRLRRVRSERKRQPSQGPPFRNRYGLPNGSSVL